MIAIADKTIEEGDLLDIHIDAERIQYLVLRTKEPIADQDLILAKSLDGKNPRTITIRLLKKVI